MKINSAEFARGIIGTNDILYDGVPQIAFVGRSNVGKSSVINALVNRKDLVKTSKEPGKTTEINFFSINRGKFYFVDLPGYGYAKKSPKEKEKIEKLILWYLMYSEVKPHKVALILDIKAGLTDFDEEMLQVLRKKGHPFVIIANKVDKLNQKEFAKQRALITSAAHEMSVFPYSAVTREGNDALLNELLH